MKSEARILRYRTLYLTPIREEREIRVKVEKALKRRLRVS